MTDKLTVTRTPLEGLISYVDRVRITPLYKWMATPFTLAQQCNYGRGRPDSRASGFLFPPTYHG